MSASANTSPIKSPYYLPNKQRPKKNEPSLTAKSFFQPNERSQISGLDKRDFSGSSKLPAVADLLNLRVKHIDGEVYKAMIDLTKYAQNLEHVIRSKDKEILRLEYVNKYLTLAHQNKEQLLTQTLEENRKLKELSFAAERKSPEKRHQIAKNPNPNSASTQSGSKKPSKEMTSKQGSTFSGEDFKKNVNQSSPPGRKSSSPLRSKNPRSRDESKNQSILKMNEGEVNTLYAENDSFHQLEELLAIEENFIREVSDYDQSKMTKFYESLLTLKEDHSSLRAMVFKLKRIIKATITMTTSLMLDEAIERIIDETCECLDCDRATTFIYDNAREELWSKAAKGSKETIRVPVNKGIVGHVFSKGEALNIFNAYTDERFNKNIDVKTGYKTNTILTAPIKDDASKVIGVIQAVNKKGSHSYFTKDDEAFIGLLANLAGVVLKNSMSYNEQLSLHTVLRSALRAGVSLNSLHELSQLLLTAEKWLKTLMGVEKAQIVMKSPNKNELFSILSDGTRQIYPLGCGIVGKVIVTGEYENITNGYGHPLFNGMIDIETSMPLLCLPIKDPSTEKIIGALEIINSKGIQGLSSVQRANVNSLDLETLEFFSKNLAQAVLNCYMWERSKAQAKGETYYLDLEKDENDALAKESLARYKSNIEQKEQISSPAQLLKSQLSNYSYNKKISEVNENEGHTSDSNVEDDDVE